MDNKLLKLAELDGKNLIKYKTVTNLEEFNKNRPGFSSDDDGGGVELPTADILNEFKDARFYTDHHFLKLASQLKEKSMGINMNKPVNVVEPIRMTASNNESIVTSEAPMSPISSSLWKLQREQYEDRIRYLEEQIKGFYEQLEIQTQVNAELKKLLIASIGTDIQYKIERLVNDKQRFEIELTSNSQRLAKLSEELEQVSIQCDLWRTKFIASKSMNDELSTWKTFLLLLQQENNQLIRSILNDNEQMNQKLNNIYRNLIYFKEKDTGRALKTIHPTNNVKLINLIDKIINEIVGESQQQQQTSCDSNILNTTTKNEYLAKQMLTQFSWLPSSSCSSIDLIESLLNGLKLQKTKLIQRYDFYNDDSVNLTCCSKCKGNVKIV